MFAVLNLQTSRFLSSLVTNALSPLVVGIISLVSSLSYEIISEG